MKRRRILIVDDDADVRGVIREIFQDRGFDYEFLEAAGGDEALTVIKKEPLDLVLLDIMLGPSSIDGFSVLRRMRPFSQVTVLMVSARSGIEDILEAGYYGANGYVTKPFEPFSKLTDSVAEALNHPARLPVPELRLFDDGYLRIDPLARPVSIKGKPVELPPKERDLLFLLLQYAGSAVPNEMLLISVWGEEFRDAKDTLHDHIYKLRKFIEPDPHLPRYITTAGEHGYEFSGLKSQ